MMIRRKPVTPAPKNDTGALYLALSQQRELSQTLIETSRNMATVIRSNAKAMEQAAKQMENMADNMQAALVISDHALALLRASEAA